MMIDISRPHTSKQYHMNELRGFGIKIDSHYDELVSSISDDLKTLKQDLVRVVQKDLTLTGFSSKHGHFDSNVGTHMSPKSTKSHEEALKDEVERLETAVERYHGEINLLKRRLTVSLKTDQIVLSRDHHPATTTPIPLELGDEKKTTIIESTDYRVVGGINNLKPDTSFMSLDVQDTTGISGRRRFFPSNDDTIGEKFKMNNIVVKDCLEYMRIHNLTLSEVEDGAAEILKQIKSLVIENVSGTNRVQSLLETNKKLLSEVSSLKLENAKIRGGRNQKSAIPADHSQSIDGGEGCDNEVVILSLKKQIKDNLRGRELFADNVDKKMRREREVMLSEIYNLREKLKIIQDENNDSEYKERFLVSLQSLCAAKDDEVRILRKETKRLRDKAHKPHGRLQEVMQISKLVKRFKSSQKHTSRDKHEQADLFTQIITSMEDFCKYEEQTMHKLSSTSAATTREHDSRGRGRRDRRKSYQNNHSHR